mmetsp:Transcript_58956/g.189616  ORF Transcript_58956/g.189616 Transcript_58956/m.189616 type:complete len:268 (-) Transcript_58956:313-1116(-)
MRSPPGKAQAARNSRCPVPAGAACVVALPLRRCRRCTSPCSVVISSSSPAKARPGRALPPPPPGGKWTSPAGLQPPRPPSWVKSATVAGISRSRRATVRPAVLAMGQPMAAASSCEPAGSGRRSPADGLQGQAPSSAGMWPGQWSSSPALVTNSKPASVQAAPARGPSSPSPSSAKGCACTPPRPSSESGTRAPKPWEVKAATLLRLLLCGPQSRWCGSNSGGHATVLTSRGGAKKTGGASGLGTGSGVSALHASRSARDPLAGCQP